MSSAGGRGDLGEPAPQGRDDLGGLVCGERRLGEVGDRALRLERELEPVHVVGAFDDVKPFRCLAESPDDLLVVGMADEDEVVVLARVAARLGVHLGDQRAGGVDDLEIAAARRPAGERPGRRRARPARRPRPAAPRRSPRRTRRPWTRGRGRRAGCGRSDGGRRRALRGAPSARSTISIARSTPAQNDRGAASSTSCSPQARAQRSSGRRTASSDPSARAPPSTGPHSLVSEMDRITASGLFGRQPMTQADSMSTATAPEAASASALAGPGHIAARTRAAR